MLAHLRSDRRPDGRVAEWYEKSLVEDLIGQVWGVREVHNHLCVSPA